MFAYEGLVAYKRAFRPIIRSRGQTGVAGLSVGRLEIGRSNLLKQRLHVGGTSKRHRALPQKRLVTLREPGLIRQPRCRALCTD